MAVQNPDVGWQQSTLGTVVSDTGGIIQTGPFGSQLHASDYVQSGTPLIMPINLGDNVIVADGIARVGPKDVRRLQRHVLREGDIVFSRRGDVGRRSIVRHEQAGWLCGTGCLAVRFGPRRSIINPEFVALSLGSQQAQTWLQDNAVGGTMPNLNTGILASTPISIPSRATQDSIVTAIDAATDTLVVLKRLIAKKQAIVLGVMQDLLTGRTRLPGFTQRWHKRQMGELGISYGGLTNKSKEDFGVGAGKYIPFMAVMSGIRVTRQSLLKVRISRGEHQNVVQSGDLLFNTSSETPDELAMCTVARDLPDNVYLNSFCFGFRLTATGSADATFLAYLFRSNVGRQLMSVLAQGSTRYNLSRSQFGNVQLSLPDIDEQRAIADVIDDASAEIEVLQTRLIKAQEIKQGMMQALLSGRKRLEVEETVA